MEKIHNQEPEIHIIFVAKREYDCAGFQIIGLFFTKIEAEEAHHIE